MNGDQRARAGSIDGDRRTAQVQVVSQAGGEDRAGTAPHCLCRRPARVERVIVVAVVADVDAAARPVDRAADITGVLERVPRLLQKQALLRVHVGRFDAGDIEEERIEAIDVTQKAATPTTFPRALASDRAV